MTEQGQARRVFPPSFSRCAVSLTVAASRPFSPKELELSHGGSDDLLFLSQSSGLYRARSALAWLDEAATRVSLGENLG